MAGFQNTGSLEVDVSTQSINSQIVEVFPSSRDDTVVISVGYWSVECAVGEGDVGIVLCNTLLECETVGFDVRSFRDASAFLLLKFDKFYVFVDINDTKSKNLCIYKSFNL